MNNPRSFLNFEVTISMCAFFAACSGYPDSELLTEDGTGVDTTELSERSFGGSEASIVDPTPVPANALLGMVQVQGAKNLCSGMLIANDRVITAAHCLCTEDFVGSNTCQARGTVIFRPNPFGPSAPPMDGSVTAHPDFNPSWINREGENDLAIVDLDGVAPAYAQPFAVRRQYVPSGSFLKIVGFGSSGADCQMGAGTLNFDVVRLDSYTDGDRIIEFHDPAFCSGDSGGALFLGEELVGVHSGKFFTFSHGSVSKSIALHHYYKWIFDQTCRSDLWNRCDRKGPICECDAGIGDCDVDADCSGRNVCRENVGLTFGYPQGVDVCARPGPLEGSCNCSRSGLGGLCTPAFNNCSATYTPTCNPKNTLGGQTCGGCTCQR